MRKTRLDPATIMELPIFPLPNLVFFPGTLLPLHVFEERYRKMVADVIQGEGRIGVVLLRPGWEVHYHGSPEVFSVGGMGIVSHCEKLSDGRFNVLLTGKQRFRIIEFFMETPYRIGRVEVLADLTEVTQRSEELAQALLRDFSELVTATPLADQLATLEKADFPTLVNSICAAVQLSPLDKQGLLEIDSIDARAQAVRDILARLLKQRNLVSSFSHLRPDNPIFN